MFENSPEWVQFWIINPIRHLLIAVIFLIPYGLLMMWSVKNNGKMHPAVRLAANTILALPYLLLLSLGIGLLALGIVGIYALFVNSWEAKMALLQQYSCYLARYIRGGQLNLYVGQISMREMKMKIEHQEIGLCGSTVTSSSSLSSRSS